jgi:hypothetical protein
MRDTENSIPRTRTAIPDGVALKPLDVIELRVAVDAWEAGTLATVLETRSDTLLAEVADDAGRTLDVITVPLDAASRINTPEQKRLKV